MKKSELVAAPRAASAISKETDFYPDVHRCLA
jgi:hypothetical protein